MLKSQGASVEKSHKHITKRYNHKNRKVSVKNGKNHDRRLELLGVFLIMFSVLSTCGIFGLNAGFVGFRLAELLYYLFGVGALFSQAVLFLTGMYFILHHKGFTVNARFFGCVFLFSMLLAFYHYVKTPVEGIDVGGGILGGSIVSILKNFFGEIGSFIVIVCGIIGSGLFATNCSLQKGILFTEEKTLKGIGAGIAAFLTFRKGIEEKRHKKEEEEFVEANLYNQATDNAFPEDAVKEEYGSDIIAAPNKETIGEYEENAINAIHSENPGEFEDEVRNFAENDEFKENTLEENVYDENTVENSVNENINENNVNEANSNKNDLENVNDDILNEENFNENVEKNYYEDDGLESDTEETAATPSPVIAPPSERGESGMDAAGFVVRADAFRSRDEIPAYPENNEEELDLSEPDFRDEREIREDLAYRKEDASSVERNVDNANRDETLYADNRGYGEGKFVNDDFDAHNEEEEVEPLPPKPYELPVVEHILSKKVKKQNLALKIEIEDNARTLAKTLEDFKVKANIKNACHGPAVTRYELEPAPGVKVSKITGLSEDLALALAATSVRIEPIPGKSAIGIEVPNKELEGVQLREVLERPEFLEAESKLTVGLGVDIGGQAIFADLAKMPHLLVAGATGSGKSVCINTIITGILFKAKPDEVKFILIDPKMVELSNYNGIPHLMVPVVTDAKKAASVLNWAVQEMEKRYSKFAEKVVRNMETYNNKFPEDKMSAIVIIIDELADLMMVAPHEVEDAICRLAQKARAAGIHLVLATQRPSVDVITGIIKANIPSRIAFAVSSQVDSRTILDSSGAEKLLGRGDMLFYPIGAPKPRRVQGAFVSDEEVELLLDFIRSQGQEMEANEDIINFTERAEEEENDKSKSKKDDSLKVDELLADAVELVVTTGQASASNVQRRFRVGFARAGRLIDTMEQLGIVGPSLGSKPREILMDQESAMEAVMSLQENY